MYVHSTVPQTPHAAVDSQGLEIGLQIAEGRLRIGLYYDIIDMYVEERSALFWTTKSTRLGCVILPCNWSNYTSRDLKSEINQ